jgi:hypothetical protein
MTYSVPSRQSLPMIDTEIMVAVDHDWNGAPVWAPCLVIDHEDGGEWFQVRHDGDIADLSVADEGATWKRV